MRSKNSRNLEGGDCHLLSPNIQRPCFSNNILKIFHELEKMEKMAQGCHICQPLRKLVTDSVPSLFFLQARRRDKMKEQALCKKMGNWSPAVTPKIDMEIQIIYFSIQQPKGEPLPLKTLLIQSQTAQDDCLKIYENLGKTSSPSWRECQWKIVIRLFQLPVIKEKQAPHYEPRAGGVISWFWASLRIF